MKKTMRNARAATRTPECDVCQQKAGKDQIPEQWHKGTDLLFSSTACTPCPLPQWGKVLRLGHRIIRTQVLCA
uniref:Uncharacterized protein n=1 Tax=Anguilla anguilla TaxID=7936 RepID=A0A0E9UUL1_ANGAN